MKTFQQAIEARGLKVRRYRPATGGLPVRDFPDFRNVAHRALIEAQAPDALFVSEAKEYGEELQFSSRGLTDWYVREFESLNKLKR